VKDYAMHLDQWKIDALLRVRGAYDQYNKVIDNPRQLLCPKLSNVVYSYITDSLAFDSTGIPYIGIGLAKESTNHSVPLMDVDFLST
jgi:hypothetical protein